ncbi:LOW QUALITY PROTEIN: hypothetical protein CVT25_002008, partial [Psilocybe cyanescens]
MYQVHGMVPTVWRDNLKVANETIIVVSDVRVVKELLDDRSRETSSRPFFYALDVVSGGNYFALASSGECSSRVRWVRCIMTLKQIVTSGKRGAKQYNLSPQAIQGYIPIMVAETTQLLYDTLHNPEFSLYYMIFFKHLIQSSQDFCSHVSRSIFSFIASVVFGKSATRHNSPEPTQFREYMRQLSRVVSPEAASVDLIPILMYVPERWAPWKRLWRKTRKLQRALYFSLLEHAEQRINSGNRSNNFIKNILDPQSELGLNREMTAYIGGIMIDGGTDTSSTLILSLALCLLKSPDVLQKAQDEIDAVVGNKRLPVSSDINALPYIYPSNDKRCSLKIDPASFIIVVTKDIHRNFVRDLLAPLVSLMPQSMIVKYVLFYGNIWIRNNMNKDLFERPDEFWPERYLLTPDGTKPGLDKDYTIRSTFPFGSGKRLCPGMHLGATNT